MFIAVVPELGLASYAGCDAHNPHPVEVVTVERELPIRIDFHAVVAILFLSIVFLRLFTQLAITAGGPIVFTTPTRPPQNRNSRDVNKEKEKTNVFFSKNKQHSNCRYSYAVGDAHAVEPWCQNLQRV